MKYSNEVKKMGQASEGLTNTVGYPSEGSHAGKMMDNSIMSGIEGGTGDLIVSTPAKKNASPGWNSAMWSAENVNFKGRP